MKRQLLTHAAALLLALCIAAAAAPMAFATTPAEEAVLATGQRSINNPGSAFTVPNTPTGLRLLHPDTLQATRLILSNVADQFRTGHADPEAVRRIFAYAPILTNEELPEGHQWDDMLQYILEYGMHNIYIALRETDRPGVYQVIALYYNWDGAARWAPQALEYDSNTGWLYDTSDVGLMGIGFDYNVCEYMLRTAPGTWQRSLGYNLLYDLGAPLAFIRMDTLRFPFSYEGRDWMIQFWKGTYMPSNGAEVGIYEKDPGQPFFWDCSETMLDISMKLYHHNDTLFYDYGTQRTWWTGGFKYGNFRLTPLLPAKQLRLTGTITFEDQGMADAFLASFEANKGAYMTGTMEGLVFSFDWKAEK